MVNSIQIDIFVEDRAHETFLVPLVQRIAREEDVPITPTVRSARGGHAKAISELLLYQKMMIRGSAQIRTPDVLVVGIDGNCTSFSKQTQEIQNSMHEIFRNRLVVACPDPHIERWYLADPICFAKLIGITPNIEKKKCARDYYKHELAKAIAKGGHPVLLGGIEYAKEIVDQMDFYRSGKEDHSLKAFVESFQAKLHEYR